MLLSNISAEIPNQGRDEFQKQLHVLRRRRLGHIIRRQISRISGERVHFLRRSPNLAFLCDVNQPRLQERVQVPVQRRLRNVRQPLCKLQRCTVARQ
ncbi:hypothetical protein D3C84_1080060 [compost metagenome]